MRSQNGMSGLPHGATWWGVVRTLRAAIFSCWLEPRERRYRPERHYMRGPGPKWRAKHRHFGWARSHSGLGEMHAKRSRTTGATNF